MDRHLWEYYFSGSTDGPRGNFCQVIALHDGPDVDWSRASSLCSSLPKGWYELSQLPAQDRLDFIFEFWLGQLPFHPALEDFLRRFFGDLDDIGIFLSQQHSGAPFEVQMVYSLSEDRGFYRGSPPASEDGIATLQGCFPEVTFPEDYVSFMKIHNGFSKVTDTGVLAVEAIPSSYSTIQEIVESLPTMVTDRGDAVNPKTLIPFYESYDMPCYQCFWGDWYPSNETGNEMGNVYFSGIEGNISSCSDFSALAENLAFPTFVDWLMFYLERVE